MIHAVNCWRRSVVRLVDRDALARAEVGIDPVLLGAHRDAGIEHEEPEPACVEREVLHRPPVTGRHLRVVQRVRQHPLGRPLEDRELLDLVGDGRRDLEPGGARADEREPLAREVEPVGPPCRVERRAGERVHAGDVGKPGDVQRTDRADDEPRLEDLRAPVRVPNADLPGARRLVPRERRHRGAEAAVRTELVLVEHADEVVAQLGLLAEVLGPVVRRLERVAVVMTADVDTRTRVRVLPPGTARTLVLLDDHEGKAGLRQADPREDAGQASADHDDRRRRLRLVRHLVAPRDRVAVGAVELHVLEEHRHHDPLERLAREERHHLDEDVSGQLVRDAPAVPVGGDGRHRTSPDVGKLLVVETALQVGGVRHAPERQFADP